MIYNNLTLAQLASKTSSKSYFDLVKELASKQVFQHGGLIYKRDPISGEWKQEEK